MSACGMPCIRHIPSPLRVQDSRVHWPSLIRMQLRHVQGRHKRPARKPCTTVNTPRTPRRRIRLAAHRAAPRRRHAAAAKRDEARPERATGHAAVRNAAAASIGSPARRKPRTGGRRGLRGTVAAVTDRGLPKRDQTSRAGPSAHRATPPTLAGGGVSAPSAVLALLTWTAFTSAVH
jgi:hypothetical protein